MIKRLLPLLLLCVASAFAQAGGPTATPPLGNTVETNQIPSADSNFSSGTFAGYAQVNACATVTTNNPFPGDTFSAQLNCSAGFTTGAFTFHETLHGHEAILVAWQAFAPTGYLGKGLSITFADNVHGGGSVLWSYGRTSPIINGPTGGWVQQFAEIYLNTLEHGADSDIAVHFNINVAAGSSADYFVSHLTVQQEWFPLRNFVAGPNYRGYVWTDLAPATTYQHGVATCGGAAIGTVCGDAEVDPPPTQSLSTVTLKETIQNSSTCAGGGAILATDSIASPSAIQPWSFTAASYGGVPSVGTSYYVCATLNVTSGGALLASYPPFQLVFENAAFRISTLVSYYQPSGQWILAGIKAFLLGVYDRFSSGRCAGCVYTTKSNYETSISGLGRGLLPSATASVGNFGWATWGSAKVEILGNIIVDSNGKIEQVTSCSGTCTTQSPLPPAWNNTVLGTTTDNAGANQVVWTNKGAGPASQQGNQFADYSASQFTCLLKSFGTDSAINPTFGADQLTPEMAAFADYGLCGWQIMDNWMGYGVSETGVSANPAAPTASAGTGGSITANFAFVQWVGVYSPISQGNTRAVATTLPSTATVVNLSAASCAGANCTLPITTPACTSIRQVGGMIFVGTNSINSQPANSAMFQQYPASIISPMLTTSDYLPCGATFTLASLVAGGSNPPTTDSTGTGAGSGAGRPSWSTSGQSDQTLWGLAIGTAGNANGMCFNPTPSADAGWYLYDEPSLYSYGFGMEMYSYFRANCPQIPASGVIIDDTTDQLFRDMTDVGGSDPYGPLAVANPEDYVSGVSATNSGTMYTTFQQTGTTTQYFMNTADQYSNSWARATYGARPCWMVFRQFGSGTFISFPYLAVRQQIWKVLDGCMAGGTLGPGALGWGWVSGTGMEDSCLNLTVQNCPAAWLDSQRAYGEAKSLIPVMEQPAIDSSLMNAGTGLVSNSTGAQVTAVGGQQIVSNITTSVTTASACQNNSSGANIQYVNTINYPFGPVEWVSKYFTPSSTMLKDIYIFTTNYCANPTPFMVTFGLAAVPAATSVLVLNEGRTIPISTSGCPNSTPACFTDSWGSFDVHNYAIEQPRGTVIH